MCLYNLMVNYLSGWWWNFVIDIFWNTEWQNEGFLQEQVHQLTGWRAVWSSHTVWGVYVRATSFRWQLKSNPELSICCLFSFASIMLWQSPMKRFKELGKYFPKVVDLTPLDQSQISADYCNSMMWPDWQNDSQKETDFIPRLSSDSNINSIRWLTVSNARCGNQKRSMTDGSASRRRNDQCSRWRQFQPAISSRSSIQWSVCALQGMKELSTASCNDYLQPVKITE